jgi:hypothetical protein
MPGRNRLVQRVDEPHEDFGEVLRKRIRDLRRTRSLLVQSTGGRLGGDQVAPTFIAVRYLVHRIAI